MGDIKDAEIYPVACLYTLRMIVETGALMPAQESRHNGNMPRLVIIVTWCPMLGSLGTLLSDNEIHSLQSK